MIVPPDWYAGGQNLGLEALFFRMIDFERGLESFGSAASSSDSSSGGGVGSGVGGGGGGSW